jgi:hypothetical protein
MDMVRHDDVAMQIEVTKSVFSIPNRFYDHARNLRPAKVQRSGSSVVENPVHDKEGLARSCRRGEVPTGWKAAMQPPGEEHGLADSSVVVWQTSSVKGPHKYEVSTLHNILWPIINRPQVNNLPYSDRKDL